MPIISTRASAASITSLRTRVRQEIGDIVGDTSPDTEQARFSDTKIDRSINDMLFKMYRELSESDPGANLLSADFTYTAEGTTEGLPEAAAAAPLYKLEWLDNDIPVLLRRVDPHRLESVRAGEPVWTLLDRSVAIRPLPAEDMLLRVWYIGNPFTLEGGLSTDQHPYPVAHEELIVLGAARRLLSRDDEWGTVHEIRYQEEWMDFQVQAARYMGPINPTSHRRYS